jgi:hypothetical protein
VVPTFTLPIFPLLALIYVAVKTAEMSDGKTTVFEAAKGIRRTTTVFLEVAEVATAPPPAAFAPYDWRPLTPSQLLTENQASTGVLEPGGLPNPRVVLLHRHLQSLLPAELTAHVHAFDVRSTSLGLSLLDDDGSVTQVTGKSDAALSLLATASHAPLERAVCLFGWKRPGRPGYTTADWDGKFTRQALLQMLAFERHYRRPVIVVLTDFHSTFIPRCVSLRASMREGTWGMTSDLPSSIYWSTAAQTEPS